MPTTYFSRVVIIVSALLISLFLIFGIPSARLFDPNLSLIQKTNLKPGIDMVGGVRLIYEIQPPPGQANNADLATEVMDALKRRVDPNGLRNLVWRPEGGTRLEIQMPLAPHAAQATQIKEDFDKAQQQLEATNIRTDAVVNAVEKLHGNQRDQRLAELAAGSQTRADLFQRMAQTYDQLQTLRANAQHLPLSLLATKLEPLSVSYDLLKSQVEATNLSSSEFEAILDQASSDSDDQKKIGQAKVADLKKQFADFPARLEAMDVLQKNYEKYGTVKMAITGAADLKRLLQGSGVLEFHILADPVSVSAADLQTMEARLAPEGRGPLPQPGDTIRWMEVETRDEFDKPGHPQQTHEWNGKYYVPVLVSPDASMTKATLPKWALEHAYQEADDRGLRSVGFQFDAAGTKLFGDLTSYWANYARRQGSEMRSRLAIVLDDKVISAPSIDEPITGGSGIIRGGDTGFDVKEADYLINTLNAGSLPAQLSSEPISEEQVSPTLGVDNLYRGLIACAFGLVVVGVFLISYYYLAGLVAFIAVCMNVLLILGVMAALNATFTLPSIAGIVLTVGTAVDANVLIFERLREEQHKGLALRMALRNSYQQARSAIIDSNMTSIITSLCLFIFGSEEVKGFGLTLIIGIVASLFTALYVTKTIFGILIDKFGMKHLGSIPLTFPKWDRALRPNWDWIGKAWIFYTFSIIMIAIGLVLFVIKTKEGKMMDIEFSSGTSVQVELNGPMTVEQVRPFVDRASRADPQALPSPSVVAVGTDRLHYEIISPSDDRAGVKAAVLSALQGHLKIVLPSNFDQVNAEYTAARDTSILPINDASFSVDGFTPSAAADHVGGVAIVLRNLSPPLSVEQIRQRLDNERLSSSAQGITAIEYNVQSPGDPSKPTSFAVIVGWDPSVSFAADEGKWIEELAKPLWSMTRDAVNRPPSFEKETNFGPQVAGEMQRDALLALSFSILGIMAYIWVRFGNLKYATATVIALLHDTVFTLAALGFAHYISDYWLNNFLQIEPFRINLTVVAGILTIMSYSMIDTIVVFDRIRERRGRYGHLNRHVINEAINQTLSRTLLTAGTTIMTVSFMYFMGGAGIHGFTFVLLIGILVGTYSSVAIAAPLLLWGRERAPTGVVRARFGQLQRAAG
jgi:SecD/SecF fusion protein